MVWCSIWYITLLLAPPLPYSRKMRSPLIQSGNFLWNNLTILVSIFNPWEIYITICYGLIWFSFILVQSVSQYQIHLFSHMVVISGWYTSFSLLLTFFGCGNLSKNFYKYCGWKRKYKSENILHKSVILNYIGHRFVIIDVWWHRSVKFTYILARKFHRGQKIT